MPVLRLSLGMHAYGTIQFDTQYKKYSSQQLRLFIKTTPALGGLPGWKLQLSALRLAAQPMTGY